VEANGFLIGVKPFSCKGTTASFKAIERFPSSFDFVIAFPMDYELEFLSLDSIFENLFNFSFFLFCGIHSEWFFEARLSEA